MLRVACVQFHFSCDIVYDAFIEIYLIYYCDVGVRMYELGYK